MDFSRKVSFLLIIYDLNIMKKTLLFLVASFSVLSGAAQLKTAEQVALKQPLSVSRVNPEVQVQEMQLRAPGEALSAPRKDSDSFMPYYRRPAGAFYSPMFVVNGVEKYYITPGVLQLKPIATILTIALLTKPMIMVPSTGAIPPMMNIMERLQGTSPPTMVMKSLKRHSSQ